MAKQAFLMRILLVCIAVTFGMTFYLAFTPLQEAVCTCSHKDARRITQTGSEVHPRDPETGHDAGNDGHRLAVLVPFRDRFEELMEFVPHLSSFLTNQNKQHKIVILNQVDKYRFNRASLINVGYLEMKAECDHMAMHDVDLLPVNPELEYKFPEQGPYHLAAPHLHPLYHYKTFVGGILLIRNEHFEMLNGLSNRYWGWGREDDEFYVRMKKAGLQVSRPGNLTTGYKSFKHIHDKRKRPRDNYRYFDQREKTKRLDRETGLATVNYTLDSRREITIDTYPVTILNIMLDCNIEKTPWCLRPEDHEWYLKQRDQQGEVH